jgi:hypothetical protein
MDLLVVLRGSSKVMVKSTERSAPMGPGSADPPASEHAVSAIDARSAADSTELRRCDCRPDTRALMTHLQMLRLRLFAGRQFQGRCR